MLGISAWFGLSGPASWIGFMLVAAALALGLLAMTGERRWGRGLAIFSFAAAIGCALIWVRAESVAEPRLERPRMAEFTSEILAAEKLPARGTVRLILAPREAPKLPPKVRVTLPEKASALLKPGAVVRLRAYLMPPAPMAVPGGYDFSRAAWFEGIGATGRLIGEPALPASRAG